ncbi:hypothetical protein F3087_28650 [Nocardia colli]|uniref:Helix-turn-helix domain-containing protein n=1 Tax=Nocardia colli TaxID=2545717 RepID=A0A5N0EBQ5_9NOCA|nr:hypothetical protein [Nocardia colli]KAA8885604.1 hypothetical protein F3087_28650 [Nocardia colli]
MSSESRDYMITVMTRDKDHAPDPRISAVIRSNDESEPHIVELTVHASEQGATLPHAVRDINFEQLAKALLSTVAASALLTDAQPAAPRNDKPVQPRRSSGNGSTSSNDANNRPYRKMPAVDEVQAVFLETGSVGKLAKHFDVPRYTAQSWVDRLRRSGVLEPPVAS